MRALTGPLGGPALLGKACGLSSRGAAAVIYEKSMVCGVFVGTLKSALSFQVCFLAPG